MIIDPTNEIYTNLKAACTTCEILKGYPEIEPTYPCVIFSSSTSSNYDTIDSSGETHNDFTVNIDIYADGSKAHSTIDSIRNEIDGLLADTYKLVRTVDEPMDMFGTRIRRRVMRYEGIVSKNNVIYRR